MHDIPQRKSLLKLPGAHKGKVSGLCWSDGDRLLSCGVDRTVKLWDTRTMSDANGDMDVEAGPSQVRIEYVTQICFGLTITPKGRKPINIFPGKYAFKYVTKPSTSYSQTYTNSSSIDHHRTDPLFATASSIVQIWDETKSVLII